MKRNNKLINKQLNLNVFVRLNVGLIWFKGLKSKSSQ